ncbi:transcription factor S-II, central domain-containing protein [Crepidotus variabilis]|uniref:Transcription elongation factor n=1 Tax=Crepidotus variabilis TaxID=179855 RepID=A0A9P6EJS7_9AGAR|nr:transcription factor S-II, central domain-containing protein [Crepidotus variabilis]
MSDSIVVELKKTVKHLQSASSDEDVLAILKQLKEKQVTEGILRESKVGLAVGKLRNHKTKAVSELSKEIVKQWKASVEKAKATSGSASINAAKSPVVPTTPVGQKNDIRNSKTDGVKGGTGDTTRDRCLELIYDGLACDATAPIDHVLNKARGVEAAVFKDKGGTTAEYKSKIRSLFVNLKDKANPSLRASIVDGSISADKLATMTNDDMKSEERKAADKKIEEENFFKSLSAAEKQAETDAFQCSRCKQRKCRYRQQQTRSADEPMTTFVTCTVCGNKWKFS